MKKIALIMCVAMLVASFAGCTNNKPAAPAASAAPAPASAADAVASASPKESSDPNALVQGLSKDGFWIFSILSDVTVDQEIVVEGEFHDKDDASAKLYRKLALYAQDADRKVTAQYTLTAPKMTVKSPAFRIQNGTFKGDIFVEADGFELVDATVEGNVAFATQANKDSANIETAKISGTVSVAGAAIDTVTSASPKESSDPEALVKGLSKDGFWIFSVLSDVTVDKEIVVDGEFHDKDDASAKLYRKLALYAQDADRKVTAQYTLTAPKMTVKSPAFRIQNGTFKGDIFVEADGFELVDATVEGNVTFATQANKDSANIDTAKISGTVSVG